MINFTLMSDDKKVIRLHKYINNFDTFYKNNIANNKINLVMEMFEHGGYSQLHIWDIHISHSELVNLQNYFDIHFPMYLI